MLHLLILIISFTHAELDDIYLYWSQPDTAHTISIGFFSDKQESLNKVVYDLVSHNKAADYQFSMTPSFSTKVAETPIQATHFFLNQLKDNTTYFFRVIDISGKLSSEFKFKTLPLDNTPIHLVSGGDVNLHEDVAKLAKAALKPNTAAFLIGGDLAYENGDTKKYQLWLSWMKQMVSLLKLPDNRLVPVIVALGNHEVNRQKNADAKIKAPFYFSFFRQRNDFSFFKRYLGPNTVLYSLDTGHIASYDGEQLNWLKNELQSDAKIKFKLALYHVPLYPSFRPEDDFPSVQGRKHWAPVFDKYQLSVAFENHDHAFKRTFNIFQNKKTDKSGTIYLGDGCWGVAPRPVSTNRWYLFKTAVEKHLWQVFISDKKMALEATGLKNKKLDSFTIDN